MSIIGDWPHTYSHPESVPMNLEAFIQSTHPTVQQVCGSIPFPLDNGIALIQSIQDKSSIYGMSDASLKHGRDTHAWIISSGNADDITNPMLHISGSGPVNGLPQYLPSSRRELQGITVTYGIPLLL
jgi:hypothetical protein